MDGRRARLITRPLDKLPKIPERTPAPGTRLALGWAMLLGLGWPIAIEIAVALEPTPADPNAAPSALGTAAWAIVQVALVATAVGAGLRHRATAIGATVTGVVLFTMSLTCPLSGHHAYGLWWVAQIGLVTAMLAVSVAALLGRGRAAT